MMLSQTDFDDYKTISLEEFLRERKIGEPVIAHFIEEKIDCSTVLLMSEEELQNLIPKYGDRIAIKHFALKKSSCKKQSLIERLKEKMLSRDKSKKSEDKKETDSKRGKCAKMTRFIEIGWHCSDKDNRYRHVRKSHGGGTRRVSMNKNSTYNDILNLGKKLFFPNGRSTKGSLEEFDFELLDYKCHKFDANMTIQEMYDLSALTTLRFYVASTRRVSTDFSDHDEHYVPETVTSGFGEAVGGTDGDSDCTATSTSLQPVQGEVAATPRRSERLRHPYIDDIRNYVTFFPEDDLIDDVNTLDRTRERTLGEYSFSNFHEIEEISQSPVQLMTLPEPEIVEKLVLHRGKVFFELIESAKNRNIDFQALQIEMILPNGCSEQAEDMGGVLRDSISEFFISFYELCTMGAQFKIPSLRHDFQEEEWSAIGKIIQQSFIAQKYFPIKLAPVFLKSCFEEHPNEEEILENFLKYVSFSDAAVVKTALKNFEDADSDELLEFCTSYNAKCIPTKENFKKMLLQIAKEELIQKPSFVKECFYPHLKRLKHIINLEEINLKYLPTDKNIIAMFNTDENLTSEKKQILSYLKKYIKESDEKTRSSFLRFATGSDLANHPIKIDFINSEGFTRSPIAHTCTGLLQLPLSYENFIAFRNEFNNLLSADVWVMDII